MTRSLGRHGAGVWLHRTGDRSTDWVPRFFDASAVYHVLTWKFFALALP